MSETSQMNYDVIISGLGPTGLTLANILGQNGLQVLILEREQTYYGNARAVYTDDECCVFISRSVWQSNSIRTCSKIC